MASTTPPTDPFDTVVALIDEPMEPSVYNSLDSIPFAPAPADPNQEQQDGHDNMMYHHDPPSLQAEPHVMNDPTAPWIHAHENATAPLPAAFATDPNTTTLTPNDAMDPLPADPIPLGPNVAVMTSPTVVQGNQIQTCFPHHSHFIFGIGMFYPLHNEHFKMLALEHLQACLHQDDAFRALAEQRKAAAASSQVAGFLTRVSDYRLWRVVPQTEGAKPPAIKKTNWETLWYEDVTDNIAAKQDKVSEVLRNILPKALNPQVTNSKEGRAVGGATMSPTTLSPTTSGANVNKRIRPAPEAMTPQAESPTLTEEEEQEENKLIALALEEIKKEVKADIAYLEALGELPSFKREVEYGVVRERLNRLRSAKLKAVKTGMSPQAWAEQLAKHLIPKDEREEGTFDKEGHLEANKLDGDRKVCVEYLKILNKSFGNMGKRRSGKTFSRETFGWDSFPHLGNGSCQSTILQQFGNQLSTWSALVCRKASGIGFQMVQGRLAGSCQ